MTVAALAHRHARVVGLAALALVVAGGLAAFALPSAI